MNAFEKRWIMENASLLVKGGTAITNSTVEVDYFNGVYSNTSLTPITVFVFVIGLIMGIIGPISIIWYERNCNNRFRTILNQMFARSAWYLLAYCLLIYIPEGVRFLYGPFGETYCDAHIVLRNILWICLILTLDCILVFRYVFIFLLKNFGVICDDVLAIIFNGSIVLVSIWASLVKRVTPGKLPLNYYLCCGMDPNENGVEGNYINTMSKYNTGRIILIVSFLLHTIMIPRILYYQLVTLRNEQPLQLGTLENNECSNNASSDAQRPSNRTKKTIKSLNNSKTILDMVTQTTFLLCLFAIGVMVRISDEVEPKHYNLDKHKYIPISVQIYLPFFGFVAIHTVLFTRNQAMRQNIWSKLKINFRTNQVGIVE